MLKALHPDGSDHLAPDVPKSEFEVDDPHEIDWRCPIENCELAFVDAEKRVKHFRHLGDYEHESVSESPQHIAIKQHLYSVFKNDININSVSLESLVGNQIADILLTINGDLVAVEIQLSKQSTQEFKRRSKYYNNRNVPVLWIVGDKYFETKSVKHHTGISYIDQLKWLKKQYYGRVYSAHILQYGIEKYTKASGGVAVYSNRIQPVGKPNSVYNYKFFAQNESKEVDDLRIEIATKSNDYYDDIEEIDIGWFNEGQWWK